MEPPQSHTAPSFYRRPAPGQLRGHVGEVRDAVVSDQHRDVTPFIRMHMHVLFLVLVIAFDAHVLQWTLDDAPPDGYARHHIKEASFFGVDRWSVDLVLQGPAATEPLTVNFIGIDESGMWPAKKAASALSSGNNSYAVMDMFR